MDDGTANREGDRHAETPAGLPLMIDLAGKRCLLVGGGRVAARRLPQLVRLGAQVDVVAPDVHPAVQRAIDRGEARLQRRDFVAGDTAGAFLTVAATSRADVDRQVAVEVLDRGGLIAVAHDPRLGNCSFMAVTTRGPLIVAIQSGGASPLVSAALRARVESVIPATLEESLDIIATARRDLKLRVTDAAERGRRWKLVADGGLLERLLFDPEQRGAAELRETLGLDT